jgi:hypothetical protein
VLVKELSTQKSEEVLCLKVLQSSAMARDQMKWMRIVLLLQPWPMPILTLRVVECGRGCELGTRNWRCRDEIPNRIIVPACVRSGTPSVSIYPWPCSNPYTTCNRLMEIGPTSVIRRAYQGRLAGTCIAEAIPIEVHSV